MGGGGGGVNGVQKPDFSGFFPFHGKNVRGSAMIPDHGLSVHRSDYPPGVPIGAAEDERPLLSVPCFAFSFCFDHALVAVCFFSSQNLFNSWPRTDRSRKPLAKNKNLKRAFSIGKPRKTMRKAYIPLSRFFGVFWPFLGFFDFPFL